MTKSKKIHGEENMTTCVLVGTYRKDNAEWIKEKKLYNLPLPSCGKTAFHEKISQIVLIAEGFVSIALEAKFKQVVDAKWLKENGYKVAAADKAHGTSYALYELGEKVAVATALANPVADVFVASQRCPSVRIDAAFYAKPYPKTGGKSMPYIFDKLKPYFKKWHSATTFNPVQMDFFQLLKVKNSVRSLSLSRSRKSNNRKTAISLFSGAGGLDIGVGQAGFHIRACVELDKNACETLRYNISAQHLDTKVYEGDIKSFDPMEIIEDVGLKSEELDLLFGGPPCQAFSLIGKQRSLDDERGILLFQMIRYTEALRPKVVMMEQVKGLLSAKDSTGRRGGVLAKLLSEFDRLGYVVKYKVCLAADYGVPQMRERVILIATRGRNGFEFPSATHMDPKENNLFSSKLPKWVTVGSVLQGLCEVHQKEKGRTSYPDDFFNHVDVTPERDRERIHHVPEGLYLASQTHLPESIIGNLQRRDTTKYLRLNRSSQSNTLRCGEIFFHPTEDRYLTPREYMRIHGYPDKYILKGPIRSRTGSVKNLDQHRQVANSVPPPLAKAVAECVMRFLSDEGEEV